MSDKFIIFDTDHYAGNFEREMVAYISGQVGDCEVGSAQAALAEKEVGLAWFEENIVFHPDEHGCHRPADSEPTPGWWNDGKGGHFRDSEYVSGNKYPCYQSVSMAVAEWPPDDILNMIIQRAKYFAQHRPG